MRKVGFVSLGCPKNLVDSEVMMGLLAEGGFQLTSRAEEAEILVVNTCSFIPVPGGVGPMTIAMLLVNTLKAAEISVE